jgi:hypothetical protein
LFTEKQGYLAARQGCPRQKGHVYREAGLSAAKQPLFIARQACSPQRKVVLPRITQFCGGQGCVAVSKVTLRQTSLSGGKLTLSTGKSNLAVAKQGCLAQTNPAYCW